MKADLLLKNANIINVYTDEIEKRDVAVKDGYIIGFGDYDADEIRDIKGLFLSPGLVDSHVHIESSMVSVPEFAKAVLRHGTTTIVADPHEIANVLGTKGIEYMIESAKDLPLDVYFMVPSCVPATHMETAGAIINAEDMKPFLKKDKVLGLGEMMNYPGVIGRDPEVMNRINAALEQGKVVDGHAPSVTGKDLSSYVGAGIGSDHECVSSEEALEKISLGMHIMVREGTCARNLDDLFPAINEKTSSRMMWCTDDRHPHDLKDGHINDIINSSISLGLDPAIAVRMGSLNPCNYFKIRDKGAIAPGMKADFIVVEDLSNFYPKEVYKSGALVAKDQKICDDVEFKAPPKSPGVMNLNKEDLDFSIKAEKENINIIGAVKDQVVTDLIQGKAKIEDGFAVSDVERDILKICVIERYSGRAKTGKGFVKGFGLQKGAFASSVAHDSHNILVVGTNDDDMHAAVEKIIDMKGGFAVACDKKIKASLSLPIAGLMSEKSVDEVMDELDIVLKEVSEIGAVYKDPFITLGFLSLPVIPILKLTDHGLVDVTKFEIVPLFVD
jgi:adenine deaminase